MTHHNKPVDLQDLLLVNVGGPLKCGAQPFLSPFCHTF